MKLNGHKVSGPNVEVIVIPRTDGDLVFKCQAVLDFSEFEKMCPQPKAPKIQKRGQSTPDQDFADPQFRELVRKRSEQHSAFLIMESLKATPGLEWEKVEFLKPDTWSLVPEELKEAGLTPFEISRLLGAIHAANGLDDDRYREAKTRFLAIQAVAEPPA